MLSPDRCQNPSTEEGIHPTLHVSESWHVNTAEKTCNRGWDEQGLAGCRGVTTSQENIWCRETKIYTQMTMVRSYTGQNQYYYTLLD